MHLILYRIFIPGYYDSKKCKPESKCVYSIRKSKNTCWKFYPFFVPRSDFANTWNLNTEIEDLRENEKVRETILACS